MKKQALCLALAGALVLGSSAWATDYSGGNYSDSTSGGNAILANGTTDTYTNVTVTKTGTMDRSESADFVGTNAAVLAKGGANLTITGSTVSSSTTHGNGIFSYGGGSGDGTTVTVSNTEITTTGDCSGGIMTTGGGIMTASNLTITTSGGSSAAIRSDRDGGTVTVTGGTYTTSGTGSPAIYSTADITVSNATLKTTKSEGVVIEGKNSVTLNNCTLDASNTSHNNSNSTTYKAVMLYQSQSGDASSGTSVFSMTGGSLTNAKGDIFFVTNNSATITLSGATLTNSDSTGALLRAEAAGWGTSGSNGGKVTLTASGQTLTGDMIVDDVSSLTLNLKDGSTFTGAITDGSSSSSSSTSEVSLADTRAVNVVIEAGSTWNLTGDSYVTSLTNNGTIASSGGYTLYVNDSEYDGTVDSGSSDTGSSDTDDTGSDTGSDSGDSDSTGPVSSSSGSGGCDAGFASLALATLCGLLLGVQRKR